MLYRPCIGTMNIIHNFILNPFNPYAILVCLPSAVSNYRIPPALKITPDSSHSPPPKSGYEVLTAKAVSSYRIPPWGEIMPDSSNYPPKSGYEVLKAQAASRYRIPPWFKISTDSSQTPPKSGYAALKALHQCLQSPLRMVQHPIQPAPGQDNRRKYRKHHKR